MKLNFPSISIGLSLLLPFASHALDFKYLTEKVKEAQHSVDGYNILSNLAAETSKTPDQYYRNFAVLSDVAHAKVGIKVSVKAVLAMQVSSTSIYKDAEYQGLEKQRIEDLISQNRIVGTQAEEAPDFPDCFEIRIKDKDGADYMGTGTLVSPNVIVTAAHCCTNGYKIVGVSNYLKLEPGIVGEDYDADSIGDVVPHPSYDPKIDPRMNASPNDVAFLILKTPSGTPPRRFANGNVFANGSEDALVVGFGATNAAGTARMGTRRKAVIAVKPDTGSTWPDFAKQNHCDPQLEFIAAKNKFGSDSCKGDSGGPVYMKDGNVYVLAGTTSRSLKENGVCGLGGIYERTDSFESWVVEESKKHGGNWP